MLSFLTKDSAKLRSLNFSLARSPLFRVSPSFYLFDIPDEYLKPQGVLLKMLDERSDSFRAGILAMIAGVLFIASGVASGSILLTGLSYLDRFVGASAPSAQFVVNIAIVMLTFVVGLGGILDLAGGFLLLRKHSTSGRFLVGLGGGSAILGLLFSIAVALYSTGLSAPIFQQSYFTLYWIGAVLATASILFSLRGRNR
jgi:hypothetical protein